MPSLKCSVKLFSSTFLMHKDLCVFKKICCYVCCLAVFSLSPTLFCTWIMNFLFGQHDLVFVSTSVVFVSVIARSQGGLIGKPYYNYL